MSDKDHETDSGSKLDENLTDKSDITDDDSETKKLDDQIEEATKQLENMEHPEEIDINPTMNEDFMKSFFENIKSLPRDKAVQLLANLAKNNHLPDHKFTSVNEQRKKQNERNIKDRIRELKLRRSSKTILTNYEEKIKERLEKDKEDKSANIETVEDPITLTKSQKKKHRYTANKKSKQNSASSKDT